MSGNKKDILTQNPTYPYGKIYQNFKNNWYSKELWNIYRVTGYKDSLFKKLFYFYDFWKSENMIMYLDLI